MRNRLLVLALFLGAVIYLWAPRPDAATLAQNGDTTGSETWAQKYWPKFGSANPESPIEKESQTASRHSSARPATAATTDTEAVPGASPTEIAPANPETPVVDEEHPKFTGSPLTLQEQYKIEHDLLAQSESVGAIYGATLNNLVDQKPLGASASALTPAATKVPFAKSRPHIYNPYPDYNSEAWKANNKGEYAQCDGPDGPVEDWSAFVGHAEAFADPHIGSYNLLKIDNNICFERETRLGPVGHLEDEEVNSTATDRWSDVKWGELQKQCVKKNAARFALVEKKPPGPESSDGEVKREETPVGSTNRTAVLWRSWSGRTYTEDDKQIIRALVSDLALRTGGEYQVYLLVHVREGELPIYDDPEVYQQAIQDNVPEEFWDMTILWNEPKMRELYPKIQPDWAVSVHHAQYLPLQKFAHDHPQFEFFWNWETDARYTGNHYDLVEKLALWGKAQPRKGMWERNERYYIPSYHGDYDTQFRKEVEMESGEETVWGPVPLRDITPIGPVPPVADPKDDDYEWGVGEEADHISLHPIFNPVSTNWVIRNDLWGWQGAENTPRRTAIGTHTRSSRRLLEAMHIENRKGNHIASEMCAPTLSFLHGLKAVFAPIPMFFDRPWEGRNLTKYFNPGPKGVSGSTMDAPFSLGVESRYAGTTWYYRATPPQRLYNHWLGWQDDGIGGPEWENANGRPCLPPILLHPIKDVEKPPPDFSSSSSA
ncbi:hypothetical protein G7Y89_g1595 [Cudoniella acicularis]|uniref:Major facilitator superfamily transporter n=1 Tax=Cudoniella acicularis TaxID=354080 RepID=A0A8H4RUX3_9HELO|nr:hypothetical protein G7Y89_g1595 [Cudoniella acicularis]